MMDRQKGMVVFECDGCGEVLDTEKRQLLDANEVRREAGWKAIEGDGEWKHKCPGCL